MKKLFVISLCAASIFSSSAFAKTEGSYFGVDLLNTTVKFNERYSSDISPHAQLRRPSFSGSSYGFGAHYSYAANMNGLFIAPGLFFERNGASATGDGNETTSNGNRTSQRMQVLQRYGIKTDIGYDVTDTVGLYLTAGYAGISYRTKNFSDTAGRVTTIKNGVTGDWFYGAGAKFDCGKNTAVIVEYNTQSFVAPTSTIGSANNLNSVYKTRLGVAKIGLAFRF